MTSQDMQHAHAETAVLVLLTPYPRRRVHQGRESAISATQGPDTRKLLRVEAGALAHQADRGRDIARFLDRRLDARAMRIGLWIIMTPQAAMLDIDGFRQVRRQGDETVVGDMVHPFDDLGNAAAGACCLA